MLHRYRILNAILTLREFTVADLARYSGVKDTTVRTVLGREARFVERDGTRAQSRRGGQPIQYRLRADAEQDLVGILRELESVGANLPPLVEEQEDPLMLSLIAAEDILLCQLPQATLTDRAGLVELATADYEAVQFLVEDERGEAAIHGQVVALLLRLAEVEQEMLAPASPSPDTWNTGWPAQATPTLSHESEKKVEALGRSWRSLLQAFSATVLSDRELLPDLVHRVSSSPVGPAVLASGREKPETAGAGPPRAHTHTLNGGDPILPVPDRATPILYETTFA
jgi:hypothetical protein